MGVNLLTACHVHKVKVFHFRGEEQYTIIPFYYKHRDCLENDPSMSVETLEDQTQEQDWMATPAEGGYKHDYEIQFLHPMYKDKPGEQKWIVDEDNEPEESEDTSSPTPVVSKEE